MYHTWRRNKLMKALIISSLSNYCMVKTKTIIQYAFCISNHSLNTDYLQWNRYAKKRKHMVASYSYDLFILCKSRMLNVIYHQETIHVCNVVHNHASCQCMLLWGMTVAWRLTSYYPVSEQLNYRLIRFKPIRKAMHISVLKLVVSCRRFRLLRSRLLSIGYVYETICQRRVRVSIEAASTIRTS